VLSSKVEDDPFVVEFIKFCATTFAGS